MAKDDVQENKGKGERPDKPDNKPVSIHIDKKQYPSPNPTTGAALYVLGGVNQEEYDLYRETQGHGDDEQIFNNTTTVELKNGDHFFSVKKKLNPGGRKWL